jgi:polyisoprenoid-binding protein YceI
MASVKADGSPYSTSMDDIMFGKFKTSEYPRIIFRLSELVLKEAPKAKDQPYLFDSKGDLAIAGVTNKVSVPVSVTPLGNGTIKISGTANLKMTDFKIDPPAPKVALGMITTGDDVKILFDWVVQQKKDK